MAKATKAKHSPGTRACCTPGCHNRSLSEDCEYCPRCLGRIKRRMEEAREAKREASEVGGIVGDLQMSKRKARRGNRDPG